MHNDLYEIYNFGTPFLGHLYYILDLSDHDHGVMKLTTLVDPSVVCLSLGLSDQCLGVNFKMKIKKKIQQFYSF